MIAYPSEVVGKLELLKVVEGNYFEEHYKLGYKILEFIWFQGNTTNIPSTMHVRYNEELLSSKSYELYKDKEHLKEEYKELHISS